MDFVNIFYFLLGFLFPIYHYIYVPNVTQL